MTSGDGLLSSTRPLAACHDLVMLDLDGVVYVGADAVPGAAEALGAARSAGSSIAYLTNNASRTADAVATHLAELGMPISSAADVVTSAQAVARLVAGAVPEGSTVLLIGGQGLRAPLEQWGLICSDVYDDNTAAVVQGYHPDVSWRHLAEASYAVQNGVPWFASNTDLTIPTPRGIAPGNGSLVATVTRATGRHPVVAGKPERPLFDETLRRVAASSPLMVGDRPDTDIDGAIAAGIPGLAVLTGVATLDDLAALSRGHRPAFVAAGLDGLLVVHPEVSIVSGAATCGGARVEISAGTVRRTAGLPDSVDVLRAAVSLAWAVVDQGCERPLLDGTLRA